MNELEAKFDQNLKLEGLEDSQRFLNALGQREFIERDDQNQPHRVW